MYTIFYILYTQIVSEWAEYDVECAKTLCMCDEICTFTTKKNTVCILRKCMKTVLYFSSMRSNCRLPHGKYRSKHTDC